MFRKLHLWFIEIQAKLEYKIREYLNNLPKD